MAHSLEVRVPFLDHVLLEFAATIPTEYKLKRLELKHVLKQAVADLVPSSTLRRPKVGFSAPIAHWLRGELRPLVQDVLSIGAIRKQGIFRPEFVRRIVNDHCNYSENHESAIWALIAFSVWHENHIASNNFVHCTMAGSRSLAGRSGPTEVLAA
jgi:asparagine synthase (glutamine-hydrolysing)